MLRLRVIPKWLLGLLIFFAVLGFADATYLTVEHYTNTNPPCFVGNCEIVLTSVYATIAGIPVALLGMVYYLFILIMLFVYIESKKEIALRIALLTTAIGLLMSLYFFILQAFVIRAFCQYCLFSAISSMGLFITAMYGIVKWREEKL